MRKIKEIIIHCSASPNGRDDRAEDVHRWHLERGWDGIGYHYVIEISGNLASGRPLYWAGAHARGHNANSIGICLIGTDEFNSKQIARLRETINNLKMFYPDSKVIGHNEVSEKACPNFNVKQWLKDEFKQEDAK